MGEFIRTVHSNRKGPEAELMKAITQAIQQGRSALSEFESKQVLAAYQIPVTREILVHDVDGLLKASHEIGCPAVLKGCSSDISHKTESGLIRVDIGNIKTKCFGC